MRSNKSFIRSIFCQNTYTGREQSEFTGLHFQIHQKQIVKKWGLKSEKYVNFAFYWKLVHGAIFHGALTTLIYTKTGGVKEHLIDISQFLGC